jgi:hypothetical protein
MVGSCKKFLLQQTFYISKHLPLAREKISLIRCLLNTLEMFCNVLAITKVSHFIILGCGPRTNNLKLS